MQKTTEISNLRALFPALELNVYNKPLIYLDNSATTHKPISVIDGISEFYKTKNSNIHRGVHHLSEAATKAYEDARIKVQSFIGAQHSSEIIFTRGTTESINLVAFSFGEAFIKEGDEIIISALEHHSNIVPWQMLCERKKAQLKILYFDKNTELKPDDLANLITYRTKLISLTWVSNLIGTVVPIQEMIQIAHKKGVPVMVDAAQAIQHMPINVKELDADFLAFSAHKAYGPTGVGVLYGKTKWLDQMPPYQGGGDMIETVTFEKTTYNQLPFKFEAGTANFVDVHATGLAIDFMQSIGMNQIMAAENALMDYAVDTLEAIEGISIVGKPAKRAGAISFNLGDIHHYDVGMLLDKLGIAVRTGTHCAQPALNLLGITGTVRASFAMYNTFEEIDALADALHYIKKIF